MSPKSRESTKAIVKNLRKASFSERRDGKNDRRYMNTFLWNDRRCGIADRRKRTRVKNSMTLSENDIIKILS